ncbi:hypothetical protein QBC33DRAFT_589546 [Phialemonium atrogriseum]|uniref:BZIP domain-containing protein n=1 Tax=Phialemonium atrogriseum TaxID=1093897 RepID=A0AAJ0BXK2_9PEZI|nr:uncharacterized protein QBC33DRAFT_589546 [Phialemonium atrogriseum]KAK1766344.1 hypothetical protein QBC33DRAFT_589546 [Phialemonium atrogriseum]
MTTRWSSKPATHKAERLRNNQRRHRERARCRVAELEARLEETQLRLEAALARIADLSEELRLATTECRRPAVRGGARSVHLDGQGLSGKAIGGPGGDKPGYPEASTRSSSPPQTADSPPADRSGAVGFPIPQEPPAKDPTNPSSSPPSSCPPSPPPLLSAPPGLVPAAAAPEIGGRDNCQCAGDGDDDDLPPPVPGESTSLCGEAFAMIAQLNYGGLEVSAISRCLRPGFRREAVPGGGCRVENGVLFSVLDFISSS